MPIRGNGREPHFPEHESSPSRRFWQVDAAQVFTILASLVVAVSVVVAAWYARAAQTDAHSLAIAELKQHVVELERAKQQTEVALAVLTTQVQTKLEAISQQLDTANDRLARIEQRTR